MIFEIIDWKNRGSDQSKGVAALFRPQSHYKASYLFIEEFDVLRV